MKRYALSLNVISYDRKIRQKRRKIQEAMQGYLHVGKYGL